MKSVGNTREADIVKVRFSQLKKNVSVMLKVVSEKLKSMIIRRINSEEKSWIRENLWIRE